MAFKQTQGRSPFLKTGRGISPTLMGGSAMYQKKDIELTVEYDKGKEKMAAARSNPETKAGFEGQQGIKIDTPTGTATPNLPMHKVVRGGSFLKELDSAGKLVKQVPYYDTSSDGGKAAAELTKSVNNRNADVTSRQTRNADLYNATGGGTAPDKLSEKQKESLVKLGKAKEVPAQQRMKSTGKTPPTKQMAKKIPMKQMSKLKKKC
jgi:hypothetical protein